MHQTNPRVREQEAIKAALRGNWPVTAQQWSQLLRAACRQGMAGALAGMLQGQGIDVPECVKAAWSAEAAAIAGDNMHRLQVLEQVLGAFRRAGVEAMLLKGGALLGTLYERLDERSMTDIDLLVGEADCEAAQQALKTCGGWRGAEVLRSDFFPKFYYEQEWFVCPQRPVRIDLHARPLRPLFLARSMPAEALWRGATWVRVGMVRAMIPGVESMFVHLCAHAAYHGFEKLVWLHDIQRWAARHSPVWQVAFEKCRNWRVIRAVEAAIDAAEEFYGSFVPQEFKEALQAEGAGWQERLALWHAPRDARSAWGHVACNVLTMQGVRRRMEYLAAVLRPDDRHLRENYKGRHPGWRGVAQLVRLIRGMRGSMA